MVDIALFVQGLALFFGPERSGSETIFRPFHGDRGLGTACPDSDGELAYALLSFVWSH